MDFLACLQKLHFVFLKFYFTFYLFILPRAFLLCRVTVCLISEMWIKILYCFVGVYLTSYPGSLNTGEENLFSGPVLIEPGYEARVYQERRAVTRRRKGGEYRVAIMQKGPCTTLTSFSL